MLFLSENLNWFFKVFSLMIGKTRTRNYRFLGQKSRFLIRKTGNQVPRYFEMNPFFQIMSQLG